VRLDQLVDLLGRVAPNRVSQILFSILEPRVERARLLREQQVQLFDVPELSLGHTQLRPARVTGRQQRLPPLDHILVLVIDPVRLLLGGTCQRRAQLVLQLLDRLDALVLKRLQT